LAIDQLISLCAEGRAHPPAAPRSSSSSALCSHGTQPHCVHEDPTKRSYEGTKFLARLQLAGRGYKSR